MFFFFSFFFGNRIEWKYLPLFPSLPAIWIQFLHSNDHPTSNLGWCKCLLINPTLENPPKTSLSKNCIRTEIPGCRLQFCKRENPQIGSGKDLTVWEHLIHAARKRPSTAVVIWNRCKFREVKRTEDLKETQVRLCKNEDVCESKWEKKRRVIEKLRYLKEITCLWNLRKHPMSGSVSVSWKWKGPRRRNGQKMNSFQNQEREKTGIWNYSNKKLKRQEHNHMKN